MTEPIKPMSFDIKQACQLLSVKKTKLYELLGSGVIRGKKVGTKTIILADDLYAFLENLENFPVKGGNSNA